MKKFYKFLSLYLILFTAVIFSQDSTVTEVGPGVKFYSVFKPSVPWNIKILEIDITNPAIKIKTELAMDLLGTGLERTSAMAKRNDLPGHIVLGAVNGDYFGISAPENPYTFLSRSMIENGEFTFGCSYTGTNRRSGFALLEGNIPALELFNFSGTFYFANDSSMTFNRLNRERTDNSFVLYNKYIGSSTLTNTSGTEVRLEPVEDLTINSIIKFVAVERVSGTGNMSIGEDYILSGQGTAETFLIDNITVGDTVELILGTNPNKGNLLSLIGGGPRMITNGTRPASFVGVEGWGESHVNSRHPRTAVGFNQDSTKVYFLTVDGRQDLLSVGMSIAELADYMISIGCYHAVNLDGGGSTTMVVRNQIKNSPSGGSERSVGNALLAVAELSINQVLDSMYLTPEQIIIDSTQTKKIEINGIDLWGYTVQVSPTDLTWEVIGIKGIVDDAGFFTPYETGSGKIVGRINNFSDTVNVTVK